MAAWDDPSHQIRPLDRKMMICGLSWKGHPGKVSFTLDRTPFLANRGFCRHTLSSSITSTHTSSHISQSDDPQSEHFTKHCNLGDFTYDWSHHLTTRDFDYHTCPHSSSKAESQICGSAQYINPVNPQHFLRGSNHPAPITAAAKRRPSYSRAVPHLLPSLESSG